MRGLFALFAIVFTLVLISCQMDTRGSVEMVLVGYESPEVLKRISSAGIDLVEIMDGINVAVVALKDEEGVERLKDIEGVDFVERDVRYTLPEVERQPRSSLEDYQWSLRRIFDVDGDGEPDYWIWDFTDGSPIHVAIFDTPVDGTHPDLEGRIGVGYDPEEGLEIPSGTDYQDPDFTLDDHGTHVSGIIAALNDGNGVTGVAPGVVVHPVVMFKPFFFVGSSYYFDGVKWAIDRGIRVFSNSWGGSGYSYTLKRIIDYALEHGVVVVFSAGNDYNDSARYPASFPGVLAVGASNVRDETADFSNRGRSLSVLAPGKYVISTVPGNKYEIWSGTSMAAPHVSALAAMILSLHPDLRPSQVRKMLELSAVDLYEPGFDENSGYGRVSASALLMDPPPPGANLVVEVRDSSGNGIGAVYLSLVEEGGRAYYVKTEMNGVGKFLEIDRGQYDLFIGGPDWIDGNSNVFRPQEGIHERVRVSLEGDETLSVEVKSSLEIHTSPPSTITIVVDGSSTQAFGEWSLEPDHVPGIYTFFVPHDSTVTLLLNGNEISVRTSPESSQVCDGFGCQWRIF